MPPVGLRALSKSSALRAQAQLEGRTVPEAAALRVEDAPQNATLQTFDRVFPVGPQLVLRGAAAADHRERRQRRLLKLVSVVSVSVQPQADAALDRDLQGLAEIAKPPGPRFEPA